jgi:mutator protein MutT
MKLSKRLIPVSIILAYRVNKSGDCLIGVQKRLEEGELEGLWEFPGGKIEANESAEDCARREWLEEVGVPFEGPLSILNIYPHEYKKCRVSLYTYFGEFTGESSLEWIHLNEVDFQKIPEVNKGIIEDFKNYQEQMRGDA